PEISGGARLVHGEDLVAKSSAEPGIENALRQSVIVQVGAKRDVMRRAADALLAFGVALIVDERKAVLKKCPGVERRSESIADIEPKRHHSRNHIVKGNVARLFARHASGIAHGYSISNAQTERETGAIVCRRGGHDATDPERNTYREEAPIHRRILAEKRAGPGPFRDPVGQGVLDRGRLSRDMRSNSRPRPRLVDPALGGATEEHRRPDRGWNLRLFGRRQCLAGERPGVPRRIRREVWVP